MERKLKHLDFIQGVINRLSTNSFLLKGWSVVLVSALFALSAKDSEVKFIFLAYFPAIAFWALDAYFLSVERGYRKLYEQIRKLTADQIDFSMDTREVHLGSREWALAFLSKTLVIFHGALIGAIIIVMFIQI
jgi:tetrahydromethanopterin S-methyltransferase subunit B